MQPAISAAVRSAAATSARAYAQPTVCRITIGLARSAPEPNAPIGCGVLGPSANRDRSSGRRRGAGPVPRKRVGAAGVRTGAEAEARRKTGRRPPRRALILWLHMP